jgi:hypothetical protein
MATFGLLGLWVDIFVEWIFAVEKLFFLLANS